LLQQAYHTESIGKMFIYFADGMPTTLKAWVIPLFTIADSRSTLPKAFMHR